MLQDYAKRASRRSRPRKPRRVLITIMAIAVAMLFPSLMYYFKYRQTLQHSAHSTQNIALKINETKKTEFDFYKILPKMEIKIPKNSSQISSINGEQAKSRYTLQIASLQDIEDAERLKSQLHDLGYSVTIQPYHASNGRVWNRVLTGPFLNLADAEDTQEELRQQRFDSLLLKTK